MYVYVNMRFFSFFCGQDKALGLLIDSLGLGHGVSHYTLLDIKTITVNYKLLPFSTHDVTATGAVWKQCLANVFQGLITL